MDKRFLVHEAVNDDLITIFAISIPFISNRRPISERSIQSCLPLKLLEHITFPFSIKSKLSKLLVVSPQTVPVTTLFFFNAFETILHTQNNNADHISMFTVIPTAHHYNHYI